MKPTVIVTISFSFSIRYIVRTGLLEQLRVFCTPVIVITWQEQALIDELKAKGFEVYIFAPQNRSAAYLNIRRKIGFWFTGFRLQSASQQIQQRFLAQYAGKPKLIGIASKWFNRLKFLLPGYAQKMFVQERALVKQEAEYAEAMNLLQKIQPKAVFTVTPFHTQEDLFLIASKEFGAKMLTAILSFDNITKRGWIPVAYDLYMVWNKYNQQELYRIYPFTKQKEVAITGAAQFDFYWNKNYLLSKQDWKKLVGIPEAYDGKIILYAGGPGSLFPNEPLYLKAIDTAIKNGLIPDKPKVLFRCHPVDKVERWKAIIGESEHVVFDTSWTGKEHLVYANITDADITKLCSTLCYTDVHINLCSTMSVDGSAFGKPQIAPAYDYAGLKATKLLQEMYYQEHFLPIMRIKGVSMAYSEHELITWVNIGLANEVEMIAKSEQVLQEIISFSDGRCTERVAQILQKAILS